MEPNTLGVFPKIEITDYNISPRESIPYRVRISPTIDTQVNHSNRETPRLAHFTMNEIRENLKEQDDIEK